MEHAGIFGKTLITAFTLCFINCIVGFASSALELTEIEVLATHAIITQVTVYCIIFPIWGLIKLWRS